MEAVRALARKEGLDLRRCTAYSDSANDISMLSVLGVGAVAAGLTYQRRSRTPQW